MGKPYYVPPKIKGYLEYCYSKYPFPSAADHLETSQQLLHRQLMGEAISGILDLCSPLMKEFALRALIKAEGGAEEVAISMAIPKGRGRTWKAQLIYALATSAGVIQEKFLPIMVNEFPLSGRIYNIWIGMMQRCYNKSASGYKNYGGRGITVCEEWKQSFFYFEDWARQNGYRDNLTIDRIDNNGNYEPGNCRWATKKQQQNNRRNNVIVTVNGEGMTVSEAADKYGIERSLAYQRIRSGWTGDEMVNGKNCTKV